jgi:hypothetical protein
VIAAKVTSTSAGMAAGADRRNGLTMFNHHFEHQELQLPPLLSSWLARISSICATTPYAGALSASGLVKSTQSMTVPIQHTRFSSPRGADPQGVQLTSHPEQVIRQLPM